MEIFPKIIHLVAAARPNFMKIAPLYHALKRVKWAEPLFVHTGQHYDINMSEEFFQDLNLPTPHIHLGVGSGSHAEQTARVMMAYEKIILEKRPDMVVVAGDVNSTLAAALTSVKIGVKVAHLEAGLRSFDRTMPEEINRVVTDSIADLLWTPSPDADKNLLREGIPHAKILRVGNIMIDSLEMARPKIEVDQTHERLSLKPGEYGLVTLHRPSNVDDLEKLNLICKTFKRISERTQLVFPVHPRTKKNLEKCDLLNVLNETPDIKVIDPLRYIPFMNLLFNSALVITDSGGLQEETTYLGIPCFTLRSNTERPITIEQGTNQLCSEENIEAKIDNALKIKKNKKYEFWDGQTSKRVIKSIKHFLNISSDI